MDIEEKHKNFIKIVNNREIISDEYLNKLVQNCCEALVGEKDLYDISKLYVTHSIEIKRLYATIIYIFTNLVRGNESVEKLSTFLVSDCNIERDRAKILENYYEQWFRLIRVHLLNIGSHLPHIVDIKYAISLMANSLDSDELLFRISIKTVKCDQYLQGLKTENLEFTCDKVEMHSLYQQLKRAVKHCQRLTSGY